MFKEAVPNRYACFSVNVLFCESTKDNTVFLGLAREAVEEAIQRAKIFLAPHKTQVELKSIGPENITRRKGFICDPMSDAEWISCMTEDGSKIILPARRLNEIVYINTEQDNDIRQNWILPVHNKRSYIVTEISNSLAKKFLSDVDRKVHEGSLNLAQERVNAALKKR